MTLERVLVTGGRGQLGSELKKLLSDRGVEVAAPGREELDITDDRAVANAFEDLRPGCIFNCAAFHNLEVCERQEDRTFEVNARAVKRLAQRCADAGAKLVHLSTNYVFDGTSDRAYREDDIPRPLSAYAISKLAGEHCALSYGGDALVVRTAGLYGVHGSASKGGNFVTRVLERARAGEPIRMVDDQRLTPTYTVDLAAALVRAVDAGTSGLLHMTSSGECSWFEFARAALDLSGVRARIEPVETAIAPGGVVRPLNGVLANERAESLGLAPLRSWPEALAAYVEAAGIAASAG